MIRSIEKDHDWVSRTGVSRNVRLFAYRKNGAYYVSKGPNLNVNHLPCDKLEEVLEYANRGYMIGMRSEPIEVNGQKRPVQGLYSSNGIEVLS